MLIRNGVVDSITSIINNLNKAQRDPNTEVVIAPPSIYLLLARQLADPQIAISAQNVYDKPNGAFTGEISVEQLRDAKIDWTIIGHSERRVLLREDDDVGDLPVSLQQTCLEPQNLHFGVFFSVLGDINRGTYSS